MTREMWELGMSAWLGVAGADADNEWIRKYLMNIYNDLSCLQHQLRNRVPDEKMFEGLAAFFKVTHPLDDLNPDSQSYVGKNASQESDIVIDDEKFDKP